MEVAIQKLKILPNYEIAIPFRRFNPRNKRTLKVFLGLLFSMLKGCHGFSYFIIRGK
jgi:hypothetical protein